MRIIVQARFAEDQHAVLLCISGLPQILHQLQVRIRVPVQGPF
jgi:hypothetical protein